MKRAALILFLTAAAASAQQPPVQSALMDHLTGHWVLEGTLAKKQTVHDVTAEWVLGHHYVRVHEISREKKPDGTPQYEAMIFVAWNEEPKRYSCGWLDVFGGLTTASVAFAPPSQSELAFVFKDEKGNVWFTNTWVYDAKSDTWEWTLDNVKDGKHTTFGHVTLKRAS